jgi:hypothetical protein
MTDVAEKIMAIAKLETQKEAIIIVQENILYLDDLSLEGDLPNNILDIVEVSEKTHCMGN